jgi:hypothetical protein
MVDQPSQKVLSRSLTQKCYKSREKDRIKDDPSKKWCNTCQKGLPVENFSKGYKTCDKHHDTAKRVYTVDDLLNPDCRKRNKRKNKKDEASESESDVSDDSSEESESDSQSTEKTTTEDKSLVPLKNVRVKDLPKGLKWPGYLTEIVERTGLPRKEVMKNQTAQYKWQKYKQLN